MVNSNGWLWRSNSGFTTEDAEGGGGKIAGGLGFEFGEGGFEVADAFLEVGEAG